MEYDRFASNSKLYVFGMICLIVCLTLFFFSLFILPYLIWELNYDVPEFIVSFIYKLQDEYDYSMGISKVIVWLAFFVPCLITGVISEFVSNYIDSKMYKEDMAQSTHQRISTDKEIMTQIKKSALFGFKILSLMIAIVILILFLQFFVKLTA
jgi:hypothetical protein